MAERIAPGPVSNIKDCEAVCIHTIKIYDSCRDKDIASYKNFSNKKTIKISSQISTQNQMVLSFCTLYI